MQHYIQLQWFRISQSNTDSFKTRERDVLNGRFIRSFKCIARENIFSFISQWDILVAMVTTARQSILKTLFNHSWTVIKLRIKFDQNWPDCLGVFMSKVRPDDDGRRTTDQAYNISSLFKPSACKRENKLVEHIFTLLFRA